MQQSTSHNLLTQGLPDFVTVRGRRYRIRTDFRIWIAFEELALSKKIDSAEKVRRMLGLCCSEELPLCAESMTALAEFCRCGAPAAKSGAKKSEGARQTYRPVLSYAHDAEYIIAAFQQVYSIDLTQEDMHWWRFCALIKGLPDGCRLSSIIKWRSADTASMTDKRQKIFYRRMKKLYALPDMRTEREKDDDMISQLERLF